MLRQLRKMIPRRGGSRMVKSFDAAHISSESADLESAQLAAIMTQLNGCRGGSHW